MNRLIVALCLSLFTALLAPVPVLACIGPEPLMEVEATMPADGAEGVPLNVAVGVQLRVEESYDYEQFSVFEDSTFRITVRTIDGELVTASEAVEVEYFDDGGAFVAFGARDLPPVTQHLVELESGGKVRSWSFTTGDGPGPVPNSPPLEIATDEFFTGEPVSSCCPQAFVGECPRCFVIGSEPVATVDVRFPMLGAVSGPGFWRYTVETRRDETGHSWQPAVSGAFSDDAEFHSLRVEDDALLRHDTCVRVVARTLQGAMTISAPICIPAQGWEVPESEPYDHSTVICDEEVDGQEEGDPLDEESATDPDGGDDRTRPDDVGWELEEGQRNLDAGCGCSTGRTSLPGEWLLLLGVFAWRRPRDPNPRRSPRP